MVELVTKQDLAQAVDLVTLRLTVRLGIMLAASLTFSLTLLGAILKLT